MKNLYQKAYTLFSSGSWKVSEKAAMDLDKILDEIENHPDYANRYEIVVATEKLDSVHFVYVDSLTPGSFYRDMIKSAYLSKSKVTQMGSIVN